jgi:hypothetical protein
MLSWNTDDESALYASGLDMSRFSAEFDAAALTPEKFYDSGRSGDGLTRFDLLR